jgi:release factor glutamine methyltransferase
MSGAEVAPPACSWDALLASLSLPRLDARALLQHSSGKSREWLLAHGDEIAPPAICQQVRDLAARRQAGEPLAYLLGFREFHGRRFAVDASVLVPRPETEGLVDAALAHLPAAAPGAPAPRLLDLGTGSGAIAVTLALLRPDLSVTATDLSDQALALAQRNARALGAPPIAWHVGSWWEALPADTPAFDRVVSNPPYLADDDPHLQGDSLCCEPPMALSCGPRGMEAIEAIVAGLPRGLATGGWLLLEHGATQGVAVRDCLRAAGLHSVSTLPDLQGLDRITLGQRR